MSLSYKKTGQNGAKLGSRGETVRQNERKMGLEAYRFQGYDRPFPSHFHPHYVLGLVEAGERALTCGPRQYRLRAGDLLIFRPGECHGCTRAGEVSMDYRGLNVPAGRMEAQGPLQVQTVIRDREAAELFRALHEAVLAGGGGESLDVLTALLRARYPAPAVSTPEEGAVEAACAYMAAHCARGVRLEELCCLTGLSRAGLQRAFRRCRGMSPYRYLENLRVIRAEELLRQGTDLAQAALEAGFADQSHLTHYFSRFLGLPPGAYRGLARGGEGEKNGQPGEKLCDRSG